MRLDVFEVSRQCIDKHSVPQLIWDSPEKLTLVLLADKSAAELYFNSTLVVWTLTLHLEDFLSLKGRMRITLLFYAQG